ncbi:MAG: O-antigen ligase family protein [Candidatus Gastranaerophilales bacterium]|nr:O-antigen ligase family protein [Candidatus Gastranaerophilales bacterium]
MFTRSFFLESFNSLLGRVQSSKAAVFVKDSLLFCHIDFLIWLVFILTVISTCFMGSGTIGALALIFFALNFIRLLFKEGETVKISKLDVAFIVYFLFIFLSLMGSSLFMMSLKGFLKNIVYFLFYFSSVYFFLNNKRKILPTLLLISIIMSYESIVAVFQHFNRVEALAGWVDTSRMTSEDELISRSFGTLNPSNPNLLGGYLITGLSSVFACFMLVFTKLYGKHKGHKNCGEKTEKIKMWFFAALFILNLVAIIFTGCRGAYLGLLAFFALLIWLINYYVKKVYGGFSNIKKRYKNLILGLFATGIAAIALTPSISRRFISIFHFRGDSSISFRMNVYEAAFDMFKDNPFLGIGLGNVNFREIYGLYMKTGFDALGSYCVPLEVAVESGVFALVFFLIFVVYAASKALRIFLDENTNQTTKIVMFSIVLCIVSTMAHGLFDTVWYRPQLQIIFWINIAILNSYLLTPNTDKKA